MEQIKYDKNNQFHMLIAKKFWKLIVLKIKKYEYRKMIKGLVSGTYYMFDADTKEFLGTNYLTEDTKDVVVWETGFGEDVYYFQNKDNERAIIDKASSIWLEDNYHCKHIDFDALAISQVVEYV